MTKAQALLDWIDARFPLTSLWKEHLSEYYAPKNFNFWYYFGSLALMVLVIQIVSGIFLTMNYKPDAQQAFGSVEYIMRDVAGGWLIRYIHSTGASMFFVVVYLHMFRGLLYGSYRKPRELLWLFGVLIYLCMMAEAFFGYLLPWGQMSYWGAQVIVNLFGAVPDYRRGSRDLDSRRLCRLRRHAQPLLRVPRDRHSAGVAGTGGRAHHRAARSGLQQSRRHRDQEEEGCGTADRWTASPFIRTTRSRTWLASWCSWRCSASSSSSRRRWAATSWSTTTSSRPIR